MADEPDRDGSDDAGEQPVASNDETPTGDGDDDPERRRADDVDPETDDGGRVDGTATARDDTDDSPGVDAVDLDAVDGASDLTGPSAANEADGTSESTDTDEISESTDADDAAGTDDADSTDDAAETEGVAETDETTDEADVDDETEATDTDDGTVTDDAEGLTDADVDDTDDADADDADDMDVDDADDAEGDDSFPVAGMTAEEAAWDSNAATDSEEIGVDVENIEDGSAVEARDDQVGVQPEKQEISDDFWSDGPESDQEMPLADHIEEMMRRLGVVFLVGGVVTLVVLGVAQVVERVPTAVDIINYLWNHNVPGAPEKASRRPRVYGPLELVLTELKVAGLAGLLVGLPVFVYETYLFMRPGLYPRERRYYLAAVPTSLVLGIIGMTFAHFVVLPAIFSYFTSYTVESATVAFGLAETFNLILLLMGYMAIVFQIPLFIMLAIMMNLVTRVWLEDKRLLFWGAFAGLAFLVSPDPTGMAPIIIATTMIVLYEGTLALLRWTGN